MLRDVSAAVMIKRFNSCPLGPRRTDVDADDDHGPPGRPQSFSAGPFPAVVKGGEARIILRKGRFGSNSIAEIRSHCGRWIGHKLSPRARRRASIEVEPFKPI